MEQELGAAKALGADCAHAFLQWHSDPAVFCFAHADIHSCMRSFTAIKHETAGLFPIRRLQYTHPQYPGIFP